MSLIKKINEATQSGHLVEPFTVEVLKAWMKKMHIVKDDGDEYAESSINAILSNSDKRNFPTSNLNSKVLQSKIDRDGNHEYWF